MPSKSNQKAKRPRHFFEFAFGLISVVVIAWIASRSAFKGSILDAQNAAQFGDFIGGTVGTILLVISGWVVISGYRLQRFEEDVRSFEAHFFEMLKYHRDNMTEIEVDGIRGRRAFVSFIREWRLSLNVVREAEKRSGHTLRVEDRARLAYLAFFHGSGPNSRENLRSAASKNAYPETLVEELIAEMTRVWSNASKAPSESGGPSLREMLLKTIGLELVRRPSPGAPKQLAYRPFEGHHSRLAHYYRHLFQLIRHVAETAPEGTEQNHIDLVRAQLSTHELALLALHAYSVSDKWFESGYIGTYGLLADLPETFLAPSEFPLKDIYKNGEAVATGMNSRKELVERK